MSVLCVCCYALFDLNLFLTDMSESSCASYKDRDRIMILEKMVEDLKLLTSQQNLTIKELEKESLAKSNKISALINMEGKATLLVNSSRPTVHLSSHLPSNTSRYRQPATLKQGGLVDTSKMMQKKVEQIADERNFWKRHFQLAEGRISDLKNEKNKFQPQLVSPLQEISINKEPESLYLKKLLEENLDLKLRLAKHQKVAKSVEILEPEMSDVEKENSKPPQPIRPMVSQPVGNIQPQYLQKPSHPLQPPHLEEEVQHLAEHNKCLQHQVCKLKQELIRKANHFSCSCQAKPGLSRSKANKCPPPLKPCSKCKNHLCRAGTGGQVRFEEKLDMSSIHLCSHLACLQRQVCHLKMELEQAGRKAKGAPDRSKLEAAEVEITKLEEKCDKLLDQKKTQLERISQLQKQVETLLKTSNIDIQVQDLITDLESQRDNYKHQVQNLIKDLKSEDRIVTVEDVQSSSNRGQMYGKENVKKIANKSEIRTAFQLPSNIRRKEAANVTSQHCNTPGPEIEENDLTLELLQAKTELADKALDLNKATLEVSRLRQELDSCLAQLESYRVKQTQTSPRLERLDSLDKRSKDLENKEREVEAERRRLDRWKAELTKFKEELELQRSSVQSHQQKPRNDENSGEAGGLRQKIRWLEQQLSQTENTLRNCQHLLSENSNKSYELNTQIHKHKQEGNLVKKALDDLQLKYDNKCELTRRIIEDKDNLLNQLDEAREKLISLRTQVSQKSERLDKVDQSKDDLERRLSQMQVTVKQLEKKISDKENKVEEVLERLEKYESSNKALYIENSSLKLEIDHTRNALDKMSEESQSKSDEIVDIKSEMKRYITEVKRFEEVLDLKEADRQSLLTQYEELSKEVTAYERSNRSLGKNILNDNKYRKEHNLLEMQAANLMLEVKSREDDLAAAKQRCDSLEKYVEEVLAQNQQFRLQVGNYHHQYEYSVDAGDQPYQQGGHAR